MPSTFRCVIVDDEEMATKVILAHLDLVPDFEVVGVFHSAVEAYLELETLEPDVLFLDIEMPKMTGLAMLKMLKKPPITVLTTAHREFALEGFELEAMDYLLKPIGFQRFLQTINRIKRTLPPVRNQKVDSIPSPNDKNSSAPDHLFIRTEGDYVKLQLHSIQYIEAIKNHIRIHTDEGFFITLMPISEMEEKLPKGFMRIHRSYIVQTAKVSRFNTTQVLISETELPIGRSYREIFKKEFVERRLEEK